MSVEDKVTPVTEEIPTGEEAINHSFPKGHWLRAVGEIATGRTGEGGRLLVTRLHLVSKIGRLACNCKVNPINHKVYDVDKMATPHRELLCEESIEYLRVIVAKDRARK